MQEEANENNLINNLNFIIKTFYRMFPDFCVILIMGMIVLFLFWCFTFEKYLFTLKFLHTISTQYWTLDTILTEQLVHYVLFNSLPKQKSHRIMGKIEDKLKELNITIPTPPAPKGNELTGNSFFCTVT